MERAWTRLGETAHRRRHALAWGALVAVLSPALLVIGVAAFTSFPAELDQPPAASVRVLSRDGELLREVRTDDGARARPLAASEYPQRVRDAVLAAEDRRFYSHPGVDVLAVGRAFVADVAHRRVVSGASTLTMQLARTVRPHRRNLWGKITEAALALRIEMHLPKERILTEYLNRVSYGPNLRGFGAASQAYFAEPPAALSVAQTALIAGLPRGPSIYDVTRHPDLARQRRDRVLSRMRDDGMIDDDALRRAQDEPLVTVAAHLVRPAFGAPHFVRALLQGQLAHEQPALAETLAAAKQKPGALAEIETTLDPELQRATEAAVGRAVHALEGSHVTAGAAIVVDNATGDVLAYVGSPDFFDEEALGQNDGVTALRQPGSALKPFVYAEAMESLGYTPATLLPDVELHIPLPGGGDYVPHDYDTRTRGPVRLREALGNSLNVPAVYTLYQLGTARVLDRYHAMGFASLGETAETYGPALALGDGEVTLVEIARAYATLARGGEARPLRFVSHVSGTELADFAPGPLTRVLSERTALVLGDILSDKGARLSAFGDQNALELDFDVAAKTGTSKGYRDNVAVGFTRAVTVAAWAGNFDGSPMRDVSGIAGAGPIFHAVMEAAMQGRARDPASSSLSLGAHVGPGGSATVAERLGLERTAICPLSGMVATSACPHHVQEWLAVGEAFHAPPCAVHEPVRINVHDGLLAGPGCPDRDTDTRVFERWTAPYDEWAAQTSRRVVPTESSPECPVDAAGDDDVSDAVRITYPFDGSRFVVDPERDREHQLLDVRVDSGGRPFTVTVDGAPLAAPYTWPLAEGRHEIVARATASANAGAKGRGNRASKTVVINVR